MKRIQKPTIQKLFGGVFVAQLKHICASQTGRNSPQKVVIFKQQNNKSKHDQENKSEIDQTSALKKT